MRYAADQSEKTKDRVVKIAAAEMRKRGPNDVGVAEVMRLAGLTHGGFYAHFAAKDDLIEAAIARMFEDSRERFREWTDGKERADALRSYINAYVSTTHRDHPEGGCAVAALASEIHRQGDKARAAYDAGFSRLLKAVERLLPEGDAEKRRADAVSMLAQMTGAVAASRAVSDKKLSDEILATARRDLRARAGVTPFAPKDKAK
jgi:TetR/AcrR family transcriptional repressor of nem operon